MATEEYLLSSNLSDDSKEILEDLEEKNKSLCTQLQERLVSLSASVKSLKGAVNKEKALWKVEIKETIELENKLSRINWENYLSHDMIQEKINKEIALNMYRQKIFEADNLCKMEMLKIKNSIETLVPLQVIVDEWNTRKDEPVEDIEEKE